MNTTDRDPRFLDERIEKVFNLLKTERIEELKYYHDIQKETWGIKDISKNDMYKDKFMIYYRIYMTERHKRIFFRLLQKNKKLKEEKKNFEINFGNILSRLNDKIPQNNLLFLCSALVHTIDPHLPIWEKNLLNHLQIYPNSNNDLNPLNYYAIYINLKELSEKEIKKPWFKTWQNMFKKNKLLKLGIIRISEQTRKSLHPL